MAYIIGESRSGAEAASEQLSIIAGIILLLESPLTDGTVIKPEPDTRGLEMKVPVLISQHI